VDKADSVEVVCKEYADEWTRLENEAEQKRLAEHARAEQVSLLLFMDQGHGIDIVILTVADGGCGSGSSSGSGSGSGSASGRN
jgi:hypothetical protein